MSEAQTIKARVNQMIEREIQRCKGQIGPVNWEVHGEWVTQNIVASAKQWLTHQAAKGAL